MYVKIFYGVSEFKAKEKDVKVENNVNRQTQASS